MKQEVIAKAAEVIGKARLDGYCVLALIDEDGYPTTSAINVAKSDGIRWLVFGASVDSNKAKRLRKCNCASVSFSSAQRNINLVGTVEILTDPKTKQEMWQNGWERHWPTGSGDPDLCILRFTTERYAIFFMDDGSEDAGVLPKDGK